MPETSINCQSMINFNKTGDYEFFKRIIDFLGSLVGLVFLLPTFILIVVLIKLEDGGPVFFKQERVGKNGKNFYMYKFRSMVNSAESLLEELKNKNEADGPLFKMKNDPRVTMIGKILRKTSLDELPQLINVLRGEMSLVGPRPALPSEVEKYESWHKNRLLVSQGMTGLWQVSGRSNLTFVQMVELDLEYIRRRSLRFDFFIMVRTIPAVFGSDDAF